MLCKSRSWAKAFNHDQSAESGEQEDVNGRATIVIEHLTQALDVAHDTRHWRVCQNWNERLFNKMCLTRKAGRSPSKNPSGGVVPRELWFFDNCVIPLAKKIQDCGVLGSALSDERSSI